jgi:membrane protein YqaA with SNARE-associated domain
MDALKEWILNIIREGGNVAGSLRGSEILIKESLVFAGAILGGIWGYSLGRTIERNRWRRELRPGLETLERALEALKAQN